MLTLLYWLAEGIRIYDHDVGATVPGAPGRRPHGPPPGVHMPGPSFRPILGAIGVSMLMAGLVFGGWLLLGGVVALILTLVGWLVDALKEYRNAVAADATGHLDPLPDPRTPSLMLSVLAVIFVAGVLLQTGLLPPGSASGGAPGASGSPAPSGSAAPSGAPPPSGRAAADRARDRRREAHGPGHRVHREDHHGPGRTSRSQLAFDNSDPGMPHDVAFKDASGGYAWRGEPITGVATKVYDVPALPAGSYTFVCTIHSNMTGTATLQ